MKYLLNNLEDRGQLLDEYNRLLNKYDRLKNENRRLKEQLGLRDTEDSPCFMPESKPEKCEPIAAEGTNRPPD